jgi:hypothetical protein
MSEQHSNLEQEVEALITQGFAQCEQEEGDAAQPDAQSQRAEGAEPRVIPVDKYTLPNGETLLRLPDGSAILLPPSTNSNSLDQTVVESTVLDATGAASPSPTPLEEAAAEQEDADQEGNEMSIVPLVSPAHKAKRPALFVPLFLLLFLAASTAGYVYLLPLTATATVTIIPQTKTLHTATTLTLAAHPKAGQVQGRELEPISLTASQTVPATGHGHQDATQARGVITFYNADSSPLTVPAGVSLAPSAGITVVTTERVTIQAAIPPQFGTAIAPAYVVQAGSLGNIPAGAVQTRCCGSVFVTATNTTPFSGGEDERDYSFIQSSDIERAATEVLSRLTPEVNAALQKQGRQGEHLVTPLCMPHIIPSANGGTQAASVSVSVTQTCRSVAYALDSLEQTATALLAHIANLTNYQQVGTVQVMVNDSTYEKRGTQLRVTLSGIWMYHFSLGQLVSLSHLVAGATPEQAHARLDRQAGVSQITLNLRRFDFKDLLPSDPTHIQIVCFGVS